MEQKTPRPLTEAEARKLRNLTRDEYVAELRQRGLIAEEPVDPDLLEAREIAAAHVGSEAGAASFRAGNCDNERSVLAILAGIKRGKELRPTLTREQLAIMVDEADPCSFGFVHRLHAALLEQMQ